jgi:hypothetical protein
MPYFYHIGQNQVDDRKPAPTLEPILNATSINNQGEKA